jgi:hypothetical protein
LYERQHGALLGMLVMPHLAPMAGGGSLAGLARWFVDVGFFILWRPSICTGRRLHHGKLALILVLLAIGAWLLGGWLLIVWTTFLASLPGGRVMLFNHRPTRVFCLLTFACLVAAVLVWLAPRRVPPGLAPQGPSLKAQFAWSGPALFVGMAMLPRPRKPEPARQADAAGYTLRLAENTEGNVCFELAKRVS